MVGNGHSIGGAFRRPLGSECFVDILLKRGGINDIYFYQAWPNEDSRVQEPSRVERRGKAKVCIIYNLQCSMKTLCIFLLSCKRLIWTHTCGNGLLRRHPNSLQQRWKTQRPVGPRHRQRLFERSEKLEEISSQPRSRGKSQGLK